MKTIEIISWNVNGLRALHKKGGFGWLVDASPDIFCLQETKAKPEQLPPDAREVPGYRAYFDHSKGRQGYSGVAVYTKIEPESVDYGLGVERLDQEGRFLGLHFKDFTLCNIYFPNGGGGPERLRYKLDYYDAFLEYVDALRKKGRKVIFCGDVNTAHEAIDLARPKENEKNTGFLPIEREWLDEVARHGFVDVFRSLNPKKEGAYTYWDMKTFARERNVGWRIDYFFASADVMPNVKAAKILDSVMGSDHCPIYLSVKPF